MIVNNSITYLLFVKTQLRRDIITYKLTLYGQSIFDVFQGFLNNISLDIEVPSPSLFLFLSSPVTRKNVITIKALSHRVFCSKLRPVRKIQFLFKKR